MSDGLISSVVIAPKSEHKASIIWLHGLGDSGHGFSPIVPELKLPDSLGIKFIFPHAPIQPVTINNGSKMRAWYDIKSLDFDSRADIDGVKESEQQIRALIEAEIASGIPANKIMLIGFSQGGVVALHTGTRYTQTLAGIVAMSTYMAEPDNLAHEKHSANQDIPILCAHGQQDPVVPMYLGNVAFQTLLENGYSAVWKQYVMQHNVCFAEIQDISAFIQQYLA